MYCFIFNAFEFSLKLYMKYTIVHVYFLMQLFVIPSCLHSLNGQLLPVCYIMKCGLNLIEWNNCFHFYLHMLTNIANIGSWGKMQSSLQVTKYFLFSWEKDTRKSNMINSFVSFMKESDECTDNGKAHKSLGYLWHSPHRKMYTCFHSSLLVIGHQMTCNKVEPKGKTCTHWVGTLVLHYSFKNSLSLLMSYFPGYLSW